MKCPWVHHDCLSSVARRAKGEGVTLLSAKSARFYFLRGALIDKYLHESVVSFVLLSGIISIKGARVFNPLSSHPDAG